MLASVFGLLAALTWGGADFAGGLSSRRIGALTAAAASELVGLGLLLGLLPVFGEPLPGGRQIGLALASGVVGVMGLLALYRAIAVGQISVAAPVSALLAALLPILFGTLSEGFPGWLAVGGFGLALAAVWLISQGDLDGRARPGRLADLRLALLAGLGFGLYLILIHQASGEALLWPLIFSRTAGTLTALAVVLARRLPFPDLRQGTWALVLFNGLGDVGGNLFYLLAGQAGRMDVAAALSALYPAGTVFLAWLVLKERINRPQKAGVALALAALVLLAG